MAKTTKQRRIPKYLHHKGRNLARVVLNGKTVYLGKYNSPESRTQYDKVIAEWLVQQQQELPDKREEITLCELMAAYLKFASGYYLKNGKPTREAEMIAEACRPLRRLHELTPAVEFGPLALKTVRQTMIDKGWTRKHINKMVGRIVRMFKWGVEEELVPAATYQALAAVGGLKKGRCDAPDNAPVPPVSDAHVDAVLPRLPEVVADMVRFQRLTGCRPGEVCSMRPVDTKRDGTIRDGIWEYRPDSYKTEHHGKDRVIFIGPSAQQILSRYLLRGSHEHCFSPLDSERRRRQQMHENRQTPLNQGNKPGSKKMSCRLRPPSNSYTSDSYRRAVARACTAAGVPAWSPNQLRHSAATKIRADFGLEGAQTILGHSHAAITEVYAERDFRLAADIAAKVG